MAPKNCTFIRLRVSLSGEVFPFQEIFPIPLNLLLFAFGFGLPIVRNFPHSLWILYTKQKTTNNKLRGGLVKRIICVILACVCLSGCMGNSSHKGGARMVKGCVDKTHPFVFLLEERCGLTAIFYIAKGGQM